MSRLRTSKRNSVRRNRRKAGKNRNGALAGLESLEARRMMTVTTLSYVASAEFNQFTGGAAAAFGFGVDDGPGGITQHEPEFLGFEFGPERMSLGGVTDPGPFGGQYGAEGYFEGNGRFGLEYGYYVNGGNASILNAGNFNYELVPVNGQFQILTSLDIEESSLRTISPTVSAYADLVLEAEGELGGQACLFACTGDSTSFDLDETYPLISINRQTGLSNGVPVFDGDVKVLDIGLDQGVAIYRDIDRARNDFFESQTDEQKAFRNYENASTPAERDAAEAKFLEARDKSLKAQADERKAAESTTGGNNFQDPTAGIEVVKSPSSGGLLGLKMDVNRTIGATGSGISSNLGSLELTVPEVNLSETTSGGGDLFASTNDPDFDSDKSNIARLELNLGSLVGLKVPLLGTTNIAVGPFQASLTSVEYTLGAELDVNQEVSADALTELVIATFNAPVNATGDLISNNGSTITFLVGADVQIDPAASDLANLTADFTISKGYRVTNGLGLDIGLDGELTALKAELEAFGESLTLGPVISNSHDLFNTSVPIFEFDSYIQSVPHTFPTVEFNLAPDVSVQMRNESAVIVDDPQFSQSHQRFEFDVVVRNDGGLPASNVSVDVSDLQFVSGTLSAPGCTVSASVATCNVGTLASEDSQRFEFSGRTTLGAGSVFTADATVTSSVDSNTSNNSDSTNIPVRGNRKFYVSRADDSDRGGFFSSFDPEDECPQNLSGTSGCSLREAITAAEDFNGPATVVINANLFNPGNGSFTNTIQLDRGDILITEPIVIQGQGSDITTVNADSGSRVFDINAGNFFWQEGSVNEFFIQGMTLSGGRASAFIGESDGGAISMDAGPLSSNGGVLTIDDIHFLDNRSEDGDGGAIRAEDAVVTISNSQFSFNRGKDRGGAIHVDGGEVKIINSEFTNNFSVSGGVISVESDAEVLLQNTTITKNTTADGSGIVYSESDARIFGDRLVIYNNIGDNFSGSTLIETWTDVATLQGAHFVDTDITTEVQRDIGISDTETNGGISYEFVYTAPNNSGSNGFIGSRNPPVGDSASLKLDQFGSGGNFGVTEFGIVDHNSQIAMIENELTHVVFVADGTDMHLYVNGEFETTMPAASVNLSGEVGIGHTFNHDTNVSGDSLFRSPPMGTIHGVAVYDKALTAAEIERGSRAALANSTGSVDNVSDDNSTLLAAQNSFNVNSLVDVAEDVIVSGQAGIDVGAVTWTIPTRNIATDPAVFFAGTTVVDSRFEVVEQILRLKSGVALGNGHIFVDLQGTDEEGNEFIDTVSFEAMALPPVASFTNVERFVPVVAPEVEVAGESVRLTWNAAPDTDYHIDIESADGADIRNFVVSSADASELVVEGLSFDTIYSYTIDSKNDAGFGSDTPLPPPPPGAFLLPPPPTLPTTLKTLEAPPSNILNLEANATSNLVTLTWDDSDREFGYVISRDGAAPQLNHHFDERGDVCTAGTTGCDFSTTTAAGVTTFQFAATQDTTYEFEVKAVNGSGETIGLVTVTTPKGTPTAPTGVTVTELSSTSVRLDWNDSLGETQYRIVEPTLGATIGDANDPTLGTVGENVDWFIVTGLTPNFPYTFTVIAENEDESTPSDDALHGPRIVGRHIFYNNSAFDGNDDAINSSDDTAIATDKEALMPGETATFDNYTSFSKGINGIMIDIRGSSGLGPSFIDDDFVFRVGNDSSPSVWGTLAEQTPPIGLPSMVVRPGEGAFGSDRITFTWPDGDIKKQWLQVTILANQFTGLSSPDVHYWGNAVAETGNAVAETGNASVNTAVNSQDIDLVANSPSGFSLVGLDSDFDFNRDQRVNSADINIVATNPSGFSPLTLLSAPDTPATQPPPPMGVQAFFAQHAGDIDGDKDTDFADFLILSSNFGSNESDRDDGDLNGDKSVGFDDFLLLAANFGRS